MHNRLDKAAQHFADVVRCDYCTQFDLKNMLRDDTFNLPQPGYIGPRYWKKRILFIGQNPGRSNEHMRIGDEVLAKCLLDLAKRPDAARLRCLLDHLQEFMVTWDMAKQYLKLDSLSLSLDEIAYLNVVRCRTKGNAKPGDCMTRTCMGRHLETSLDLLRPRKVVFLGKWASEAASEEMDRRQVPHAFINRLRSWNNERRAQNLAEIAAFLQNA